MCTRKKNKWKIVVYILLGLIGTYYLVCFAPLPFVQKVWVSKSEDWSDTFKLRHHMADWLLLTRRLVDKHKTDVIGLLGHPPETTYFSNWDLVYKLGQERGLFAIDSEWLVLRLNSNGIVTDARLVSD